MKLKLGCSLDSTHGVFLYSLRGSHSAVDPKMKERGNPHIGLHLFG